MMMLLLFVLLESLHMSYAIDCYSCTNISNSSECHTVSYCANSKFCFIESSGSGENKTYTMGCDTTSRCIITTPMPTTSLNSPSHMVYNMTTTSGPLITSPAEMNMSSRSTQPMPSTTFSDTTNVATTTNVNKSTTNFSPKTYTNTTIIPGRRDLIYSEDLNMNDDEIGLKAGCCDTDTCNKHLLEPTVVSIVTPTLPENGCYDQQGEDQCQSFIVFNICKDVQNAKKICKKTCDLCELVDGQWSDWSNWTSCDVTCGNGTRMRNRACDNPEPKAGGENCTGLAEETEECTERNCPIDGNWAGWTSWTACSVTCGIGLQKRIRNCSNPFPEADGLFCLGASSDEKICKKEACNAGYKVTETWLDWSSWSECSRTCGTGLKKRSRECNGTMHLCFGDAHESDLCEIKECQRPISAFLTNGVAENGLENHTIYFTSVVTNVGNDYNSSTGQFTCRIPGIYSFHISIEKQLDVNQAYCHLMKNGNETIFVGSRSAFIHSDQYQQASNTAVLELGVGDVIYLGMCSEPKTFTIKSTFSGTLIVAEEDNNI